MEACCPEFEHMLEIDEYFTDGKDDYTWGDYHGIHYAVKFCPFCGTKL